MLSAHLSSSSGGTTSSQSSCNLHSSCKSSLRPAVTGVARPMGSKMLATRPVSTLFVKQAARAALYSPDTGSGRRPRRALPNLGGPMSSWILSSSGAQRYPASPTCVPSAETLSLGGWPENVNDFTAIEPLARISLISSATCWHAACVSWPLMMSSTYVLFFNTSAPTWQRSFSRKWSDSFSRETWHCCPLGFTP